MNDGQNRFGLTVCGGSREFRVNNHGRRGQFVYFYFEIRTIYFSVLMHLSDLGKKKYQKDKKV